MQTDRPIDSAAQDRFDRAPFARRIANVIRHRADPATLVIAIYGPWGDGKSSTLALIKEALGSSESIVQVSYNPWFFSSSVENLTRSFFLTLADALEKVGTFSREKIGDLLKKYGGLVPKFGGLFQAAGAALSVSDLKAIRTKVEAILTQHKTPIVVFVDDIDRLDRKEIQSLFKLIRLSADFPYVIYVLAFDDAIVAAALGEAYEGGDANAGRRFLEKIVQAPLHLPKANGEILQKLVFENTERLLKTNAIDLAESDLYAFANNFALGFTPLLGTPRNVKLYDNALTFAVPLLAAETNIVDLLLLEAIRTFIPALYLTIRDNPEEFLRAESRRRNDWRTDALVKDACSRCHVGDQQQSVIRDRVLERLFPRLAQTLYGDEWDRIWEKDKRICTRGYFDRYFSYGVPTGDIADSIIAQTIDAAVASDGDRLSSLFVGVAKQSAYPTFIRKLRAREADISELAAAPLMVAVANSARLLPREPSAMLPDFTIRQAGILTAHLAQKIAEPIARLDAVKASVLASDSFVYSVEILRFARKTEENGEVRGFLEESDICDLTAIMAGKIKQTAGQEPLYRFLGGDSSRVLLPWAWYGDAAALRAEIGASIGREGADGAEALIAACSGKSWEMATGIPDVGEVDQNAYRTIAKLVDPEIVCSVLRTRYGAKLDSPTFHPGSEVPLNERLALQFAYMHIRINNEKSAATTVSGD